jgi:RHS repeat-associated protein
VDEIVASLTGGAWNYHHYDARGHCILLTAPNGNVIEQYEYDAFGQPYFYNAIGGLLPNGSSYGNRFLFTGREWLKDLKLYDYRARMYQPELGRFLQPDPKQFAAGDYNLYRYCHNDPVNKSDPMGLLWAFSDKKLEADFNKVRQGFNNNPAVKALFDRIGNDKEHTVTINRSNSFSRDRDQINITNKGNSSFSWNPRAAIAFDGGRQSPATVLVHEADHADRARTDPFGTANALRAGDGPMGHLGRFGNLDDRRVILGLEAAAVKTMPGEAARSDGKGTFYEVDSPTSH